MQIRYKTFLLSLLVIIGILSVKADEYFDPSGHDEYISAYNWTTNTQPADPLETTEAFAGTFWETFAFSREGNTFMPSTGFIDFPITGTITSKSTVNKNFRRVALHLSYLTTDWRDQYPHTTFMKIATSSDFEDAQTIYPTRMLSTQGEFLIFDLPERSTNDFYQFCFEVPAGGPRDAWVGVYEIFFYTASESEAVSVDVDEENKICTLISNSGELHVIAEEYDSAGNYLGDISYIRRNDEPWTNKVAEENEPYTINFPATSGNYIEVYAKSVNNGVHSAEKYIRLTNNETPSSLKNLDIQSVDNLSPVEWYDLNGTKLEFPSKGLMIKRQNSKSSLIIHK